ncbi:hypothetical protein MMC07_000901 [Pseudocyphellaria aurata]|nr:hypothetical protein [Pseudocyphellaria aurata]
MANDKTKMPPASTDEQFKFLISCIRYSNNGKVDFTEVANECNIVSKGAAAKRYERMMKQHGLHQSAGSSRETPFTSPDKPKEAKPKATKATKATKAAGTPASKKRKVAAMDGGAIGANQDDDEGIGGMLGTDAIKNESDAIVKDEESMTDPASLPAHPNHNVETGDEEEGGASDDGVLFNDFLQMNAFEPQPQQTGNGAAHQDLADGREASKGLADGGATDLGAGSLEPGQGSILID